MLKHNACGKGACYAECFLEVLGVVLIILGTIMTLITQSRAGIVMLFIAGIMLCFHKCCLHRQKAKCPGCGCESESCCCNERCDTVKPSMNPGVNPTNPTLKDPESLSPKPPRKPTKRDIL